MTILLAGAVMVTTFWAGARSQDEDQWVRHTLAVRNQIARVLTLVQRAESSQRGYLSERTRHLSGTL